MPLNPNSKEGLRRQIVQLERNNELLVDKNHALVQECSQYRITLQKTTYQRNRFRVMAMELMDMIGDSK